MKFSFTFVLLMVCMITAYAQQKWQFKFDGGFSFPVSKYSKIDLSESFSIDEGGYPLSEGFDKKDHGAAEQGAYYTIAIKRKFLNDRLMASINYSSGYNPVNVAEISNYYTDYLDNIFYYVFEQDDYHVTQGFISAGYHHQVSNFSFTCEPLIGLSIMEFPAYKTTGYLKSTDEFRFDVMHRKDKEDSNALLFGIQSSVDIILFNRLLLGLSIRYLSANHDYVIEPKAVGLDSRGRHDTVNYRVINVGFSLGIQI